MEPGFAEFEFFGTTLYRDNRRMHNNNVSCKFRLSTKEMLLILAGCAIATVSVISVACLRSNHDGRSVLERLATELQVDTSDIADGILKLAKKAPRSLVEAKKDGPSVARYGASSKLEGRVEASNVIGSGVEETQFGREPQWEFDIDIDPEVDMEWLGQSDLVEDGEIDDVA